MHLSFRPNTEEKEDLVTVAREASIVASSLLCNHPCIQKLDLECAISTNTPAAEPSFPVFMRRQSSIPASRSLRLLHITESGSLIYRYCPETAGAHLDLRDIGAITELETLYVDIGRFSPCFAAEIDALLERNRNTLKTVVIIEARPGLNKLRMVEHLAACKVLALKSSDNIDTATPDIDGMLSRESVILLFRALDSNKIKRLTVHVGREPDDTVALLCDTLKKNPFLESLCVSIRNGDSANEILRALALNTAIINLDITLWLVATEETTAAFSGMLLRNRAITNIHARFEDDPGPFMEAFAQGLSGNRLIVDLGYSVSPAVCCPPGLLGSFHRNIAALNRATDFVLRRREDRHCAECFELFFGRSCLITKLVKIAGFSDAEARLAVAAAENRRRETYLVLTGVVRGFVVCWPADVTQIDALSGDCWCAIARYLKVTDICSQ
ncbi:hypothetical protein HPB52_020414 [Rhipicephalus sanguineus]|uniref:Uncharacterized protein n=1 Tax=Rhipicephalus sanguineus TaxID=34632 RepID=A0A9D4SRB1_RHISA|nr:hypothetical protein HPB52_020414 [Rhipicephalus sanguineus]